MRSSTKGGKKALTLLELLVAITLLGVVLLTASSILVGFKKFYFDFVQNQGEIEEVSLGVLEEITGRIKAANSIIITDSSMIDIRVDDIDPAVYTDDITHTYWLDGASIKYRYQINQDPQGQEKEIAKRISVLSFEMQPAENPTVNLVKITIGVTPQGGTQQNFETVVMARACSAN